MFTPGIIKNKMKENAYWGYQRESRLPFYECCLVCYCYISAHRTAIRSFSALDLHRKNESPSNNRLHLLNINVYSAMTLRLHCKRKAEQWREHIEFCLQTLNHC